jgi:hypothetical protein
MRDFSFMAFIAIVLIISKAHECIKIFNRLIAQDEGQAWIRHQNCYEYSPHFDFPIWEILLKTLIQIDRFF